MLDEPDDEGNVVIVEYWPEHSSHLVGVFNASVVQALTGFNAVVSEETKAKMRAAAPFTVSSWSLRAIASRGSGSASGSSSTSAIPVPTADDYTDLTGDDEESAMLGSSDSQSDPSNPEEDASEAAARLTFTVDGHVVKPPLDEHPVITVARSLVVQSAVACTLVLFHHLSYPVPSHAQRVRPFMHSLKMPTELTASSRQQHLNTMASTSTVMILLPLMCSASGHPSPCFGS